LAEMDIGISARRTTSVTLGIVMSLPPCPDRRRIRRSVLVERAVRHIVAVMHAEHEPPARRILDLRSPDDFVGVPVKQCLRRHFRTIEIGRVVPQHLDAPHPLTRVYEKYRADLLRLAGSLLNDRTAAQDVVQDAFVRFAGVARTFRLTGSLKGYLATCVANRARNLNKACL
jgi:hypothetical protein